MDLALTEHARQRLQSRSISPAVIDLLMDFGASTHDHRGAEVVCFNKAARARLRRAAPDAYRRLSKELNAYAIVSGDGALITAGWRRGHLVKD